MPYKKQIIKGKMKVMFFGVRFIFLLPLQKISKNGKEGCKTEKAYAQADVETWDVDDAE